MINEVLLLVVIYTRYYGEDYTLNREPVSYKLDIWKKKVRLGILCIFML